MGYGRLGKTEPGSLQSEPLPDPQDDATSRPNSPRLRLLFIFSLVFIVASAVSVGILFGIRPGSLSGSASHRRPSAAISLTCSKTRYPDLCVNSLVDFPGSLSASEKDLVHISVNVTLQRFGRALYSSTEINNVAMDGHVRSAYEDCIELLEDSVDQLSRSLTSLSGSAQDVMTWLSAALTNHDTCSEGLSEVSGYVKEQMEKRLMDLAELASNCLAIYAAANGDDDFAGVPIQNRRRRRLMEWPEGFPEWLSRRDRVLLQTPAPTIRADIVVAKDGTGTVKTIAEAIKKAPEHSDRRFIIHVKAGKYEEDNLKVGRKKTNLMFMGDGKGKTVISGGKSVAGGVTTFHTASFAATGTGFIARDMTFENYAGPSKHQAVALRVGADHGVVYRCSIIGYQDTLYVHSQRQFYRENDIYGTVDFIFGNAAVVFQSCNLFSRKPMPSQRNTITAQNRKDPNQNTGISIHGCKILATSDLQASKASFPTYLGRPWKMYSRTVYMLSSLGDHIHPRGWLEWNGGFALDTLYYGEYMNSGPGAALGQRVQWPGYHIIKSETEAAKFTVAQFIYGSSWLPATGVAFVAGLSP